MPKNYYRRNLPHWQPEGAEYFITFRLANSLPRTAIDRIKKLKKQLQNGRAANNFLETRIQRRIFFKYEQYLDKGHTGPLWLKEVKVADIVKEAIHYRDGRKYELYAYCIMYNHVHLVFKHLQTAQLKETEQKIKYPITDILRNLKRHSAYQSNQILNRAGAFWQGESYDRVIRNNDELENSIRYTLNNPVKAGHVERWEDWPYSYCKETLLETFCSL